MASNWPPKKNVAFTMYYFIHKNDGTIIANPTLTGSNVHVDGNVTQVTDSTLAVVDAVTGLCSIVLAQATMNGDQIDGTITASDSGAVVYTFKLLTAANTQDEIVAGTVKAKVQVDAFTADIITAAAIADDAIVAANLATGCITADAFAADAIVAATLNTGCITADAFAADAIVAATLATGALTADAFAADALVAATFATDCLTDDAVADSFFDCLADDTDVAAAVAANATIAAAIADVAATHVHAAAADTQTVAATLAASVLDHDVTAHTTASTVGKYVNDMYAGVVTDATGTNVGADSTEILTRLPDATAGAAGGLFIAGANAATSVTTALTANIIGNVTGDFTGNLSTELAKVPKSDSTVTWNATALGSIQSECADAINADAEITAIYAGTVTAATGTDVATDVVAIKAAIDAFATTADVADAVWDEASTGHTDAGKAGTQLWTDVDAILADTGTDGVVVAAASKTGYALADSTSDAVIADAVWNSAAASYGGSGTYGQLLEDAGAGADPWSVLIPGAYGAGTAGLLLGTTIPTAVADLPTNAELATALGTADDAVLAAITSAHSTTDGLITAVDNFVDTEIATLQSTLDLVHTDVDAILADTNELELDWKNGGRLDLLLDSASAAGDPWGVAIPGEYGAGTAGLMLGTTLPTAAAAILADTGTDGVVLAANAITEAKIADNAFAVEHFADDCFVAANFGDDCLVAANFGDDCFVAANFGDDCFVAANFATDSITDDAIATGAIASTAFAAGAIDAAAIAAGAIDNATFAADVGSTAKATNIIALAAEKAIGVAGLSLTAIPTIAAVTTVATTTAVTNGVTLAADAITAAGIADNAFAAEHFAAGCLDAATFAADVGTTVLESNPVAQAAAKGAWNSLVADHTIGVTFGKYLGGAPTGVTVAADIIALKAETASILEDTGTTLPATLETIDNFLDTEVAAILADTNELQVDWTDGGRLDLILDAVGAAPTAAAVADAVWDEVVTGHDGAGKAGAQLWTNLDAALADTDELQTDWTNDGRLDVILDAAASAGDPWITLIPGGYTEGMAGYIIGTNLAAVYGATEKAAIDLLDDANGLVNIHDTVDTVAANVVTTMADVAATHVVANNTLAAITPEIADLATAVAAVKVDTAAILADTGTDGVLLAAAAVDAIWDEDVNAAHQTADTAGKKLDDAGAAADPWTTLIPGGYTAGMAGKIVGDNLNAPVGTVDTVVDTLATELAKVPKSDSTVTWNATALASMQAEATDALNAYDPPTKGELDTAVDALPTAAENTAALLDHVYTDHTTTSTLGQWLNAVRTLLGHKSVENEAGDSVSYKATDDATESGTMSWGEASKTRGRYTGW